MKYLLDTHVDGHCAYCGFNVSNLLPLRGNKKQEFGLWAAEAAHVGDH
jgi:hypothetical protein